MKIVVAADSFKQCMSADVICDTVADAILSQWPETDIIKIPVADGGEGSVETILTAADGVKRTHCVQGPAFHEVESYYGLLPGHTAIIEMAAICGFTMVSPPNPETTTTFGVGQMIRKALDDGCRDIVLCIGGSATNDAGLGALAALGVAFYDYDGRTVRPTGENLSRIAGVDASQLDRRLAACRLVVACDVDNPLCGPNGAAYVFAPQKGADQAMVARLDEGLRHYAAILHDITKRDIAAMPGSGAGGGITASLTAFCDTALQPGIEVVLDAVDFDRRITDADLVITGEGKADGQTLRGKAVVGVARRAKRQGIPVLAITGAVDGAIDDLLYQEGVTAIFPSLRLAKPFAEIRDHSQDWLRLTVQNIIRTLKISL